MRKEADREGISVNALTNKILKNYCRYWRFAERFGAVIIDRPTISAILGCCPDDREKEFWQQAEVMIGMLDGCLYFEPEKYWPAYLNVHRFVFDKGINHEVGEWWPLLTREGKSIWTHMSHSWKINYHSVRAMVQCINRLKKLLKKL